MALPKKLPEVIGFYQPVDRAPTDYTGEVTDPVTGELVRLPSMTKQEFVEQCDINNIVKEYTQTGQINHINARAAQGTFEDLPEGYDFQDAQNLILRANDAFMALPSKVRDRFGNDPAKFLEFMGDEANLEEMIAMGLATERSKETTLADVKEAISAQGARSTGGDGGTPPSGGAKAP